MKKLFDYLSKKHLVATAITFTMLALGFTSLQSIKRDLWPDFALNEIIITTAYPNNSVEDIEEKITNKIEKALQNVSDIDSYTSVSNTTVSRITVKVSESVKDIDDSINDIRREIQKISDFPSDLRSEPNVFKLSVDTFPVVEISLYGSGDYEELFPYAKAFKTSLESKSYLNNIRTFGYKDPEIQILLDTEKCNLYQISVAEVYQILASRNLRKTVGNVIQNNNSYPLIADANFKSIEEIRNMIIRSNFNEQALRLKDIAHIQRSFEKDVEYARANGKTAVTFMISKSASSDVLEVMNSLEKMAADFQVQMPKGYGFTFTQDVSYILKNRLKVLMSNGIAGLILILILLPLFLPTLLSLWVALGIPTALAGTIAVMHYFGQSINIISLMAMIIIIGIIVDDAIIVVESIAQEFEKGANAIQAASVGIQKVFLPVLTTILTTILAFAPMFFMGGTMGKFVFVIPFVVVSALIFSLIECCFALPSHTSYSLKSIKKRNWRSKWLKIVRGTYESALSVSLRHPAKVLLVSIFVFIGSVLYAATFMGFNLFSEDSSVSLSINVELDKGSSLEQNRKMTQQIDKILDTVPASELQGYTVRVGYSGNRNSEFMQDGNFTQYVVDFTPPSTRKRSVAQIAKDLENQSKNLKGFKNIRYDVDAGGPPVGPAISLEIISNNADNRQRLATEILNKVKQIPHVEYVQSSSEIDKAEIQTLIDFNKLAALQLNAQQVLNTLSIASRGLKVSSQFEGVDEIDYRLKLINPEEELLSILPQIELKNSQGRLVNLKEVIQFKEQVQSPPAYHYNGVPSIKITGSIDKSQTTAQEVLNILKSRVDFNQYSDVEVKVEGESEESNKSLQQLGNSFILAIIGIFLLLSLLFNSLTLPLMVMTAIPAAAVGLIFSFSIHQMNFSFIGLIGAIGLCGVVVNDSLVLVNHCNKLIEERYDGTNLFELVKEGSADRFRAILLTSVTTISGLLPLVYGWGGNDDFIRPMAIAISYGLLFSTPFILIVLPCMYYLIQKSRLNLQARKAISNPHIANTLLAADNINMAENIIDTFDENADDTL